MVSLFLFYLYRGLKASSSSFPDAGLAACGLSVLIVSQAFPQAGGNTGLLPLTGLPMPFSGGGTILAGSYLVTGMLLALGPPGELGRRERDLILGTSIAAGMQVLTALGRSLGWLKGHTAKYPGGKGRRHLRPSRPERRAPARWIRSPSGAPRPEAGDAASAVC